MHFLFVGPAHLGRAARLDHALAKQRPPLSRRPRRRLNVCHDAPGTDLQCRKLQIFSENGKSGFCIYVEGCVIDEIRQRKLELFSENGSARYSIVVEGHYADRSQMRGPRIKEEGEAYYHMISRVVDRRMLFDTNEWRATITFPH